MKWQPVLSSLAVCLLFLTGCVTADDERRLATEIAEGETQEARLATEVALRPTPMPSATKPPPTATPEPGPPSLTFSDPTGDIISCQTGETFESGIDYYDIGDLEFMADETGVTFKATFPQTEDLRAEFGFPGTFVGILVFDDPDNPFDNQGELGRFSMGHMRLDVLWDGQGLGGRTFLRDENDAYQQAENAAEVSLEGNEVEVYISPALAPFQAGRAGFAVTTPDGCDLAGVEFDYSSGRAEGGELTLDIEDIRQWIRDNPPAGF